MTRKYPRISEIVSDGSVLLKDLCHLIKESKMIVAFTVNSTLTKFYRRIGEMINEEFLRGGRAAYGKKILATVSQQLVSEFRERLKSESLIDDRSFSLQGVKNDIVS